MFYFVRHGKTDFSETYQKIYKGFGSNMVPLSEEGVRQVMSAAEDPRLQGADIIISSPYTRAVQTAAIIAAKTGAKTLVETDLHEWVSNTDYVFEDDETAEKAYAEFFESGGVHTSPEQKWEDAAAITGRVRAVLEKYKDMDKVIVAGHGMMIKAVTGVYPGYGEIIEFEL